MQNNSELCELCNNKVGTLCYHPIFMSWLCVSCYAIVDRHDQYFVEIMESIHRSEKIHELDRREE